MGAPVDPNAPHNTWLCFPGLQISQDPSRLLDKIANLLLIFSIADSVVKKHLCTADTLGRLFDTVPHLEPAAALKV